MIKMSPSQAHLSHFSSELANSFYESNIDFKKETRSKVLALVQQKLVVVNIEPNETS